MNRRFPWNFVLAHDQEGLALDVDLAAGVFTEQHPLTTGELQGNQGAIVLDFAIADGDDLALLTFFLSGFGQEDATSGDTLLFDPPNDNAIEKRFQFHGLSPMSGNRAARGGPRAAAT